MNTSDEELKLNQEIWKKTLLISGFILVDKSFVCSNPPDGMKLEIHNLRYMGEREKLFVIRVIGCLKIPVEFIDFQRKEPYSPEELESIQEDFKLKLAEKLLKYELKSLKGYIKMRDVAKILDVSVETVLKFISKDREKYGLIHSKEMTKFFKNNRLEFDRKEFKSGTRANIIRIDSVKHLWWGYYEHR